MNEPKTNGGRRGRTLKLHLVDGSVSGVITAELGVSSVRAAVASRTALPDLLRSEEASRTGVYLLLGPDPDLPGEQMVYVGEGDQVRTRLAHHDSDPAKGFFTRAVLIVSKDDNLTKAHGRYLESRIIEMIRKAGRAKLANGNEPSFRGLPRPEIDDMERVLDEIAVLLPVLGFDVLRGSGHGLGATTGPKAATSPGAAFVAEFGKAKGRAEERGDEFVVLAGSTASRRESAGASLSVRAKRKALVEAGVLVADADPELYRFAQDTSFGSPSGGSAVIAGRSDNGRLSWRVAETGQSYGQWREGQLATPDLSGGLTQNVAETPPSTSST